MVQGCGLGKDIWIPKVWHQVDVLNLSSCLAQIGKLRKFVGFHVNKSNWAPFWANAFFDEPYQKRNDAVDDALYEMQKARDPLVQPNMKHKMMRTWRRTTEPMDLPPTVVVHSREVTLVHEKRGNRDCWACGDQASHLLAKDPPLGRGRR